MGKEDEYWKKMCETAEALDLIVPETVPFLPTHARKIRERLTLAENILKLVAELDHAYHSQWQGITAARANAATAARELVFGTDGKAEAIYEMASAQYESAKENRPLSLSEELERIADGLCKSHPDHALELRQIAESLTR